MKEARPKRMHIVSFSSYVILGKKKKIRGRNINHCNGFEGENIQPGKLKDFKSDKRKSLHVKTHRTL